MTTNQAKPKTRPKAKSPDESSASPAPLSPQPDSDQPANSRAACKKTGKAGAPRNNGNRLASGLHARPEVQAMRLELGTLPKPMARVERATNAFRRMLEAAVLETHGRIDLPMACAIEAASKWFRHGGLATAWLRKHEHAMDHGERLSYSREIAKASDSRDKAIERLRLNAGSSIEGLYAELRLGALDVAPCPGNASGANPEPHASRAGDEFQPGYGARLDPPPDGATTAATPMKDGGQA